MDADVRMYDLLEMGTFDFDPGTTPTEYIEIKNLLTMPALFMKWVTDFTWVIPPFTFSHCEIHFLQPPSLIHQ